MGILLLLLIRKIKKAQTAVWIKEANQSFLLQNAEQKLFNICEVDSKPSWNVPLRNCVEVRSVATDSQKLPPRPERLSVFSESLSNLGISQGEFILDTLFWQDQIHHYWRLMNTNETEIRNVMDVNAFCGGFSVALNNFPVWVMNIVPASMKNTLSSIYDRGLIGAFHDWCEPFSSYPRSYDLLHAIYLFSHYRNRGPGSILQDIMLEMDRLTRPQGFIIIRDDESIVSRIQELAQNFYGR
ncbi:S-adenosyl-L-methionine-dependent methyltransferases superfamily protein [Quillaja saponaria]|uniref:Methyltransferase n=1 Tax=Quillaja saponaria TaxID=32244 RepID=A0AAD7VDY7_QUISA|nr:S-adenosyl-L-methionine-dependent methyltransferases superfamily protein [Quillaja saponaria]